MRVRKATCGSSTIPGRGYLYFQFFVRPCAFGILRPCGCVRNPSVCDRGFRVLILKHCMSCMSAGAIRETKMKVEAEEEEMREENQEKANPFIEAQWRCAWRSVWEGDGGFCVGKLTLGLAKLIWHFTQIAIMSLCWVMIKGKETNCIFSHPRREKPKRRCLTACFGFCAQMYVYSLHM